MSEGTPSTEAQSGKRGRPDWSDPKRYLGFSAPYNAHASWGKTTVLYFIGHGDLTKIGIANDLQKRLATLRAGNPEGLSLVAHRTVPRPLARQIERRMHARFAALAIGREWFRELPLAEALKVAQAHIRQATAAIGRWEKDGFWSGTPWAPGADHRPLAEAERQARLADARERCDQAITALRNAPRRE